MRRKVRIDIIILYLGDSMSILEKSKQIRLNRTLLCFIDGSIPAGGRCMKIKTNMILDGRGILYNMMKILKNNYFCSVTQMY